VVLAVAAWISFGSNGVYGVSRPYILLAQPTYFESHVIHLAAVKPEKVNWQGAVEIVP
jgi:hypothetical protein